jgi:hypothetical protein
MIGRSPYRLRLRALALTVVFLAHAVAQQPQQPSSAIELSEHRAQIRAVLLRQTPLESTPAEVEKFITTKLLSKDSPAPALQPHGARGESAAQSAKRGVKSIRLDLGQYIDNPAVILLTAPLLNEKEVTVEWAFDARDRLIEIFVDKKTVIY